MASRIWNHLRKIQYQDMKETVPSRAITSLTSTLALAIRDRMDRSSVTFIDLKTRRRTVRAQRGIGWGASRWVTQAMLMRASKSVCPSRRTCWRNPAGAASLSSGDDLEQVVEDRRAQVVGLDGAHHEECHPARRPGGSGEPVVRSHSVRARSQNFR